jgi:hypothetical protein
MTTFETAAPARQELRSPAVIAKAIAGKVDYRPVESGGPERAAAGIAELVG